MAQTGTMAPVDPELSGDAGRAARRTARLSVGPTGDGWWDRTRWFIRGMLGENAYQAYLAHHERSGCPTPALSERDYWRWRTDWQERNPQGRCC